MDCSRTILDILDRSEAQLMYNMSEMTAELEITTTRTPSPEMVPGDVIFVEGALTEVGHATGRYMDPTPIASDLLDARAVSSDEKIAEILSRVKDDSPKIDPTTEQGIAEAAENMIGRAEAAIEQATDPIVKREIKKFEKKGARGVASFLTKPLNFGRRHFLKAVSAGALAAVLASCAPNVIGPVIIPDGGGGGAYPTTTEVSPVIIPTETNAPTPTEAPTPTPEITPVFIPEGFSEGEMGLLRNPETGKDSFTFNSEADWKRYKEELIGSLWQANIDWANFTGQPTDATKYSKENFIKAALEGKSLTIGLPRRLDTEGKTFSDSHSEKGQSSYVILETQEVRFDKIQLQILDAEHFKELTGKEWNGPGQEAFSQSTAVGEKGNGAIYFSVSNEGELIISIGNFDQSRLPVSSDGRLLSVGRFDSQLHDKYPNYFREDGLGINADKAVSYYAGSSLDWLNQFKAAKKDVIIFNNGSRTKYIFIGQALYPINTDSWYTSSQLFNFTR